jgi:hypothetical protein
MVMQNDAEKQIPSTEGSDGVADWRQPGALMAPVNSFDEFEILMTWLGYRQSVPADEQRRLNS